MYEEAMQTFNEMASTINWRVIWKNAEEEENQRTEEKKERNAYTLAHTPQAQK